MKIELTLNEIWEISLRILDEVDSFCRSYNIRYSLGGGSMLGAIRHKGFIPWDDDIDLIMPRPDYERFCRTYYGAHTKCYSQATNNSYITYARVCDFAYTEVDAYMPWATEQTGLWIDINPVDGIAEGKESFLQKEEKVKRAYDTMYHTRAKFASYDANEGGMWNLKVFVKKLLYAHNDIYKLISDYWRIVNLCDFDSSQYCGQLAFPCYYNKEYYPTKILQLYDEYEFCGKKYMGCKRL